MNQISYKYAVPLRKTNPEIMQIATPGSPALTLQPRNDLPPYNDIRVRKSHPDGHRPESHRQGLLR